MNSEFNEDQLSGKKLLKTIQFNSNNVNLVSSLNGNGEILGLRFLTNREDIQQAQIDFFTNPATASIAKILLTRMKGMQDGKNIIFRLPTADDYNLNSEEPFSAIIFDGSNDIIKNASKIILKKGETVQVAIGNYSNFKKKRRI